MKAIFQRQRPYSGVGEGKFFAGNWTNGSFPSGHAMFTWTIASTVAHEYHSMPLDILMYGLASNGQHYARYRRTALSFRRIRRFRSRAI